MQEKVNDTCAQIKLMKETRMRWNVIRAEYKFKCLGRQKPHLMGDEMEVKILITFVVLPLGFHDHHRVYAAVNS